VKYLRLVALTSTISCLVLASIAFSPAILSSTSSRMDLNWPRLANVGQTYEGIGSLLAIVALTGVVISLLIQVKEHKANKTQILRSFHLELMKISLSNPVCAKVWSSSPNVSDDKMKENGFINMTLWLWESRWDLGDMDEESLRTSLRIEFFPNEAPRQYWEKFGVYRTSAGTASKSRAEFFNIVNSEYKRAIASNVPVFPSADTINAAKRRRRITLISILFSATISMAFAKRHSVDGKSGI